MQPQRVTKLGRWPDGSGRFVRVIYADGQVQDQDIDTVSRELVEDYFERARAASIDLSGIVEDAQAKGRGEVTQIIRKANSVARAWNKVAENNDRLSRSDRFGSILQRGFRMAAEEARQKRAEVLQFIDRLYWLIDTYLGGREGNVAGVPLAAGGLVVGGVTIASISAAWAWIRAREVEAQQRLNAQKAALGHHERIVEQAAKEKDPAKAQAMLASAERSIAKTLPKPKASVTDRLIILVKVLALCGAAYGAWRVYSSWKGGR